VAKLIQIHRVTIIAETSLESALIDKILKMGAKGYTCSNCFGKGKHQMMEDPYTGRTQMQITVLAVTPLAEEILKHVHHLRETKHKVMGYMEPVTVYENDGFF
jgi:hypothetical protein